MPRVNSLTNRANGQLAGIVVGIGTGPPSLASFLAHWACRISGGSSVREITVRETKKRKKKGKAPWACRCSVHDFTRLARRPLTILHQRYLDIFIWNTLNQKLLHYQEWCQNQTLNHNNGSYVAERFFSSHSGRSYKLVVFLAVCSSAALGRGTADTGHFLKEISANFKEITTLV